MKHLMQKKADDLDVDGKRDELALIREVLVRHFASGVSAQRVFKDGGVLILVANTSLASEVRLHSQRLISQCNAALGATKITRLTTKVGEPVVE